MIYLCYLASGSAKRFGSNKLLYPLNGRPIYEYGLSVLHAVMNQRDDCSLIVVSRYPEILEKAETLGAAALNCPESVNGISYTIKKALSYRGAYSPGDRLLFMAADQPYIQEITVSRILDTAPALADSISDEGPLAACAAYDEPGGNPVLFSAWMVPGLLDLQGGKGGKSVLKRYPGRCLNIQCQKAEELADIDLPDDILKS
ncbi:MAG: nucleotidyltransferase family protein [Clostridia bacterium]|nr:nucleotidyltransferase family protein [Clostridia bacterium]